MSNSITQHDLEVLRNQINMATGSPMGYFTKIDKGPPYPSNIGHYHLDYVYGGVKLVRVCNDGGGINIISTGGYGSKRELYNWMCAFLLGLETRQ